jgi:predicted RNA-binding Zn-ribbon protein involved in translation (DUF1610 family)
MPSIVDLKNIFKNLKLEKVTKLFSLFYTKTFKISEQEPLNKLSLVFVIFIDIFVFINVLAGLQYATSMVPSPTDIYPCQYLFQDINFNTNNSSKVYYFNRNPIYYSKDTQNKLPYQIDPICVQTQDKFNPIRTEAKKVYDSVYGLQSGINTRDNKINKLKNEYDSALLEKIASQKKENSINLKSADEIKLEIDTLTQNNSTDKTEIDNLQNKFAEQESVKDYFKFIDNNKEKLDNNRSNSSFWYEWQIFLAQVLFLIPLVAIALFWHRFSLRKEWGFQALISWNLFLVFLIPVIFQVLAFVQFGYVFSFIIEIIGAIFSGFLVFGVYGLIVIIPLIGIGILKFLQRFVFNDKVQAAKRIQKMKCVHCARKLRLDDKFCPFCGTDQLQKCNTCDMQTYNHLKYCKNCGSKTEQTRNEESGGKNR